MENKFLNANSPLWLRSLRAGVCNVESRTRHAKGVKSGSSGILLGAQRSYQKSLIVIDVWKTGIHAKYVILLKYKKYP